MTVYEKLKEKLVLAHCPFSGVKVACCAITSDNKAFYGVNVENPALPSGLCAERSCLFGSVAYGAQVGSFKEVHVLSNSKKILYCCSACLQVITQFIQPDGKVYFYNVDGTMRETRSINELVPYQVKMEDVKFQ
ncbi:cytidine deaminase [Metamycoplasma hyosynoviae]|uniref:cytidine deaminase family protein n=1 Tax=Metamycoplasma hyosynoviae TaxID=29559 RepID=UPI0023659AEA|nr:cytidine deaminase [Metamycoplasma hyosynoviae]MDD7907610.1 cytidine deaminase [Metamycoplasma hyosynoviae]